MFTRKQKQKQQYAATLSQTREMKSDGAHHQYSSNAELVVDENASEVYDDKQSNTEHIKHVGHCPNQSK